MDVAMTASTEERLARIEGGYEHLATKADLERVQTSVERLRADMESKMNALLWKLIGAQLLIAGVAVGVMRLLG